MVVYDEKQCPDPIGCSRTKGKMTMRLAKAALFFTLAAVAACAQVNVGEQKPEASLPFTMTQVATFNLPWRIAFLPDGRMLITEKVGPRLAGDAAGREDPGGEYARGVITRARTACTASSSRRTTPPTTVSISPMSSRVIMAAAWRWLAAKLNVTATSARLEDFEVLWRQMPRGKGGQDRRADRLLAGRPIPLPHRWRPPAHDPCPGSGPARRQDPAPDAGRQTRPR